MTLPDRLSDLASDPAQFSLAQSPSAQSSPARAGRLAARLREKCLRSGSLGAALQEIGCLDSGVLAALPRLSGDVLEVQQAQALPADPLRRLTASQSPQTPRWPGLRAGTRSARGGLPVLSAEQWRAWQTEVEESTLRLARQHTSLMVLQARQTQLVSDLGADLLTLRLTSDLLHADSGLSSLWRPELAAALEARAADLTAALTVTGQLGSALSLLLGNHRLLAGRLDAATRLMLYAAQTGVSLQEALAEQARLGQWPGPLPTLP